MTTVEALITRLVNQGITVPILGGRSAAKPVGQHLSLIETGGEQPWGTHNDGRTAYRRPHVQVTAGAPTKPEALALATLAYEALTMVNTEISNGASPPNTAWFLHVTPRQEPFDLGPGPGVSARVSFNVACERRP